MNTFDPLKELFRDMQENPDQIEAPDMSELPFDIPDVEQMIEDGADPQFAMYTGAQTHLLMTSMLLLESGEFADYQAVVDAADEKFVPGFPPVTGVTDSCFQLWAICDLRFGLAKQNMGQLVVEMTQDMGAPVELTTMCARLAASRMGIYETIGEEDDRLLVRELVTDKKMLVDAPTEYVGSPGDLRFVRLGAPLRADNGYWTELTTPYILQGQTSERWSAYLQGAMSDSVVLPDGTQSTDVAARLASVFKDDHAPMPWLDFISRSYLHCLDDVIFLSGIPDDSSSLSCHETQTVMKGSQRITYVRPDRRQVLDSTTVPLTPAQRVLLCELLPELDGVVDVTTKGTQNVPLSRRQCGELAGIVAAATTRMRGAKLRTLRNLQNIVIDTLNWFSVHSPENHHGDDNDNDNDTDTDTDTDVIYQMRVDLLHSKPPIWRRIEVPDCTLDELHDQIQAVMGWQNSHLYEFLLDGERYGDVEVPDGGLIDGGDVWLSDLVQEGSKLAYLYDFGDSWEHTITVEAIGDPHASVEYPRCVKGSGNCPPEDCGGIWAYYELLATLSDPKAKGHAEAMDWHGSIDLDEFDLTRATFAMRSCFDSAGMSEDFDIHADFFDDGDLDEEEFSDYSDELLSRFANSPEFEALPGGDCGYARLVIDNGANYLAVTPANMTVAELNEIVFSIVPRKVAMEATEAKEFVIELNAFFRFLHREFEIKNALQLAAVFDRKAESRLAAELSDASNFGMAKSFFSMGKAQGFDMTTQEGLNEFMEVYNRGLAANPSANRNPFSEADEPEPSDVVAPIVRGAERLGRNDPCHCGSGKKFKKCCWQAEQ